MRRDAQRSLLERGVRWRAIRMAVWIAMLFVIAMPKVWAESGEARFVKAESCQDRLLKTDDQRKNRENWQKCIDAFLDVHQIDPVGPWAAAGLFRAAEGYLDLFQISQKASDRQNGSDLLNKIVADYPKSRYRNRAVERLTTLSGQKAKPASIPNVEPQKKDSPMPHETDTPVPSEPIAGAVPATAETAKACYQKVSGDETLAKDRANWLTCFEKFKVDHEASPDGDKGAENLYLGGKLCSELFARSHLAEDKAMGLDLLSRVTKGYPASPFRKMAQDAFLALSEQKLPPPVKPEAPPVVVVEEKKPVAAKGKKGGGESGPGLGTVTQLRFWSNPSYTRIVIDANRQTEFTYQLIEKDASHDKPPRLFMDLKGCRLSKSVDKLIPIDDNLLLNVRAGQYNDDSVRIVVDIKSFGRYKIFSLKDPFRIVLDVWGASPQPPQQAEAPQPEYGPEPVPESKPDAGSASVPEPKVDHSIPSVPTAKDISLAKQLALGVRRIVIDPGHGGADFGAPGVIDGVHEKVVVLGIAKRLSAKIRERLGCEVLMTRTDDRYLSLEERTAIANTQNADLFISIHTNAVKSAKAYGIETYYLNLATDDDAILLAARENATSTRNISDLQDILKDLMQNTKIHESSRLATHMQSAMVKGLRKRYDKIKDKGVKQAPFYVLLGAQMPSILVETSFISNERECRRLMSDEYQEAICDAIIEGIRAYIKETNPTALEKGRNGSGLHG